MRWWLRLRRDAATRLNRLKVSGSSRKFVEVQCQCADETGISSLFALEAKRPEQPPGKPRQAGAVGGGRVQLESY